MNFPICANATTDWLREHPLILVGLMGLTGFALLYWSVVGLTLRLTRDQRTQSWPRTSVMLIAMLGGVLLMAWATHLVRYVIFQ